jgi:hypothetical protein
MMPGAHFVQMVAFSKRSSHLMRYLEVMDAAGFKEVDVLRKKANGHRQRVWRSVPGRQWHSNIQGSTPASREVVLVHRAC